MQVKSRVKWPSSQVQLLQAFYWHFDSSALFSLAHASKYRFNVEDAAKIFVFTHILFNSYIHTETINLTRKRFELGTNFILTLRWWNIRGWGNKVCLRILTSYFWTICLTAYDRRNIIYDIFPMVNVRLVFEFKSSCFLNCWMSRERRRRISYFIFAAFTSIYLSFSVSLECVFDLFSSSSDRHNVGGLWFILNCVSSFKKKIFLSVLYHRRAKCKVHLQAKIRHRKLDQRRIGRSMLQMFSHFCFVSIGRRKKNLSFRSRFWKMICLRNKVYLLDFLS